ncbi:MAG: bi-domain-containing oxidoreductase [Proteobacteria bacterium]|nr:bi-domain-containing oxidoreductase [Pseudomonadota bacterium]
MKQVIQSPRTGKLAVREVPAPKVTAGHVLVRTRASLISAGTERMSVEFARKSLAGKAKARPDLVRQVLAKARRDGLGATWDAVLARLDEPMPLGYSAAGEVVAVGTGLEGVFRVGQRVAVAGAGLANHAELNVVPRALVAPVPDDVPDEEACFATLAAISLHAVRTLVPGLGDVVAVLGVGLVGQLAVQLLILSGARAVALDYNSGRLDLARRMGAHAALDLADGGVEKAVSALTAGVGCDGILIAAATDSSEPLATAAAIARDRARVCMVGATGTEFPRREFMQKELSLVVSRSYGPGRYDEDFEGRGVKYPVGFVRWTETENLAECVRLMSPALARRLDVAPLISHRFPLDEAEAAYAMVTGAGEPHLGVVLTYGGQPADAAASGARAPGPSFAAPAADPAGKGCVLGVIGAGNFARTVLLPELKKMTGVRLHTVVTRRGASAEKSRQTFGFAHAGADAAAVLENPDINAVLIATRHDSHAELTARALEAGKAVLVEKPLGLDRQQINRVIAARNGSAAFFQVGFNRRFAPMAVTVRDRLRGTEGPKFVLLRVNAGPLPADHWAHAADEGGGRILGEVCHFVDLARFLIGAPIASVLADTGEATGGISDDVTLTLRFADGSLATVAYTALGDMAFGKERIEAYAGGAVFTIDDFRTLVVAEDGRVASRGSRRRQDKGFTGALKAFVDAVAAGGPAPVDEAEVVETSFATIAVLESLRAGGRVDL